MLQSVFAHRPPLQNQVQRHYRPQRSCEGYVFTHVCHSVHRGGPASVHAGIPHPRDQAPPTPGSRHPPGADTPREQAHPLAAGTPPPAPPGPAPPSGSRPPRRRLLLLTVRILQECIIVLFVDFST